MRKIKSDVIVNAVKNAVIEINYNLDDTLVSKLEKAKEKETNNVARSILDDLLENSKIAQKGIVPLCQDTGVVVVFAEIGNDVILDTSLQKSINQGVRKGYKEGYLRKSMVSHPFNRKNTNDNTPAMVHVRLVEGDQVKLHIAAKGGGSENMSLVKILTPSAGISGVKQLVINTIKKAGGKPCPPIIVGIGIGGNFETCAILAKQALLRDLNDHSNDPIIHTLEQELYEEINSLNIGPMGVGGETTCLGVKINTHPMHIASLPVGINIQCHSARHKEVIL